jgi:2-C-methyl-D-erythritol 2,4-cyclodiphosphate synthase
MNMAELRVGLGYDLHRTIIGRPLILGNIQIPHEKGLEGHSDADIVIHALIDALTGAAGLPDVGQQFPNTDPRYKNINSAELLKAAYAVFLKAGWRLINADFVILAQRPMLSPYKPAMIKRLAEVPDQPQRQNRRTRRLRRQGKSHGLPVRRPHRTRVAAISSPSASRSAQENGK